MVNTDQQAFANQRPQREHVSGSVSDRLRAQVSRSDDPDGCWLWTGALNWKGYGRITTENGHSCGAHRVAFQLANPSHDISLLQVDHVCHNDDKACLGGKSCPHRRCVRPDHLEAVDPRTNTLRSMRVPGRRPLQLSDSTCCRGGHVFTDANTYWYRGGRRCRECQRISQAQYAQRPEVKQRRAAAAARRRRDAIAAGTWTPPTRRRGKSTDEKRAAARAYARTPERRAANLEAVRRYRARKAAAVAQEQERQT